MMSKRSRSDLKERDTKKLKTEASTSKVPISEIFADPTLDVTFKMLFGNDQHKDILISLLNSLLGFTGNKKIVKVAINSNELPVSFVSKKKGESGVESAIDILCTNKGKEKIAIEMQGQKTKYFLPREQEYMAKLISNQVREGEGKLYHERVLETYIIIIGKSKIFVGDTRLNDQTLFELDVVPMVKQTKEVVPGNKMFWKFFELPKFEESDNYKIINKDSSLKEQWLEFLIDCSKQEEEPDRDKIIKQGYEIMKVASWDPNIQALYWHQKAVEEDFFETQEEAKREEFDKGKLKGEIKGEIKAVKGYLKYEVSKEKFTPDLKFLTQDKVKDSLESNLEYIKNHLEDSDSDICEELGLVGALSDFGAQDLGI
jgi:predicted transposase/invertase (TIGR01784 family)